MKRITEWVVADAFRCLESGDVEGFFEYVDEGVQWTVMGSHLLSGTYDGKTSFRSGPFVPITRDLRDGAAVRVRHQLIDGDRAVVELETIPTDYVAKAMPHSYCWVLELTDGLITRVRAYVDAALIQAMMPN